jgi:membrane protein DedA with SNARE-associated domain
MDQVVQQLVDFISSVPVSQLFVVYLIAAAWVGTESLGIGLPIEPMLLVLGAIAAQGRLNPTLGLTSALASAVVGTLAGASTGYLIGRRAGRGISRAGRFIGLNQARVEHMELWLRRRGVLGVFLARFVPVLRGLSPYVIGASRDPVPTFLIGTVAGGLGYTGIWVVLGFILGDHYTDALDFFDRFGVLGFVLLIAIIAVAYALYYLWSRYVWNRLARHFHRHRGVQLTPTAPLP